MLNRIILIGRLTRDPELRYTPQGVPGANFSLAVDRPFANAQGNHEADFIDIVVSVHNNASHSRESLTKGRLVAVEGHLQIRSYEAQDGSKRKVAEVIADSVQFLDRPKTATQPAMATVGASAEDPAFPDDLPF